MAATRRSTMASGPISVGVGKTSCARTALVVRSHASSAVFVPPISTPTTRSPLDRSDSVSTNRCLLRPGLSTRRLLRSTAAENQLPRHLVDEAAA